MLQKKKPIKTFLFYCNVSFLFFYLSFFCGVFFHAWYLVLHEHLSVLKQDRFCSTCVPYTRRATHADGGTSVWKKKKRKSFTRVCDFFSFCYCWHTMQIQHWRCVCVFFHDYPPLDDPRWTWTWRRCFHEALSDNRVQPVPSLQPWTPWLNSPAKLRGGTVYSGECLSKSFCHFTSCQEVSTVCRLKLHGGKNSSPVSWFTVSLCLVNVPGQRSTLVHWLSTCFEGTRDERDLLRSWKASRLRWAQGENVSMWFECLFGQRSTVISGGHKTLCFKRKCDTKCREKVGGGGIKMQQKWHSYDEALFFGIVQFSVWSSPFFLCIYLVRY